MSPRLVTAVTFLAAVVVIGLYLMSVVRRYRAERRKRSVTRADTDVEARVLDRLAATASAQPATPMPPTPGPTADTPAPPIEANDSPDTASPSPGPTVASLLAGIRLPVDLVPLVSIAPRPDVDDQVAFWTKDVPAEAVGQAFAGELVRLGFTVAPLKEGAVRAERDGAALLCQVHATPSIVTVDGRQAFPSMPEGAVVVEVRVPA